jgi:preprotein translocase subunit YajC
MQNSVGVGDEIITAGGLHGLVEEIDDDRVRLEIAPDVVVTLDRRAVAAVARDVDVVVEHEDDDQEGDTLEHDEPEHDAPERDEHEAERKA